ncbi:unnamed protein product [Diamesa hyperborea]
MEAVHTETTDAPIDAKIVADKVVEEVEDTPKVAPEEPEAVVAKVVEPVVEVVTPVVEETSEATPAVVVVENGKAEEKKEVEVEKVAESDESAKRKGADTEVSDVPEKKLKTDDAAEEEPVASVEASEEAEAVTA